MLILKYVLLVCLCSHIFISAFQSTFAHVIEDEEEGETEVLYNEELRDSNGRDTHRERDRDRDRESERERMGEGERER